VFGENVDKSLVARFLMVHGLLCAHVCTVLGTAWSHGSISHNMLLK